MQLYATKVKINKKARTISGLLLPFGEPGFTNQGKVTAAAGTLDLPADQMNLNLEHDEFTPIGRSTTIDETDAGLYATFEWLETTAGNDAYIEATHGVRRGLSIEIDDPIIRDGEILGGRVTGAAQVVRPAFMSARLTASELDPVPDMGKIDEDQDGNESQEDSDMKIKKIPAGGALSASKSTPTLDAKWLYTNMAKANSDAQLRAALADIVPANTPGIEQPAYVGELWDGKAYQRRFIPMFNHADLTSYEVIGWKWLTKPEVDKWAGNKTDVPSNPVETEELKIAAERIAGAHDIDRKYRDFNNTEFFRAYFAAMTESYAKKSDLYALQDVIDAATTITRGTVPAGMPAGLVSIVDGAINILNETDTMPTSAVVALDLWREILLTPKDKTLEYLEAAIGLEKGSISKFPIAPSSQMKSGEVMVATRDAVTVHELGNGAPIRVEALDIARGGVDEGVFGYYAVNVHDAGGLALVKAGA